MPRQFLFYAGESKSWSDLCDQDLCNLNQSPNILHSNVNVTPRTEPSRIRILQIYISNTTTTNTITATTIRPLQHPSSQTITCTKNYNLCECDDKRINMWNYVTCWTIGYRLGWLVSLIYGGRIRIPRGAP